MDSYRVVIIGEAAVGKSSLTVQYLRGFFLECYDPTVDDSYQKQTEVDGKPVKLEIIDTAGQEVYSSLRDQYLRLGDGVMLIYSVADRASFDRIPKLYQHLLRVKDTDSIPCVLCGNKCDLEPENRVTFEEGEDLSVMLKGDVGFFETSARRNENITEAFSYLVKRMRLSKHNQNEPSKKSRHSAKRTVDAMDEADDDRSPSPNSIGAPKKRRGLTKFLERIVPGKPGNKSQTV